MAIDRPDLIVDERFKTGLERLTHGPELFDEIAAWTREHTKQQVMKILGDAGVPCSASFDTRDLYDDPHLNERGFVETIEHPEHGKVRLLGFAPRMSASHVPITPAPRFGEHTEQVLSAELGLSGADLESLRAQGIVR